MSALTGVGWWAIKATERVWNYAPTQESHRNDVDIVKGHCQKTNFHNVWCGMQEVQKRTLTPKWDEDKWLLVQEPKTQIMRVQMFDHDMVNLKAGPYSACFSSVPIWVMCPAAISLGCPAVLICGHPACMHRMFVAGAC